MMALCVRLVMTEDKDEMLALGKMQIEETLPHLTFERDVAEETFENSIKYADPTIFVAELDLKVIGYLVGLIQSYCFTSGIFVVQEVLYVHPDHRGTRAAASLVKAFIKWGQELEAREIIFGISNNFQPDRTAKFFELFGAKRCGFYLKKI